MRIKTPLKDTYGVTRRRTWIMFLCLTLSLSLLLFYILSLQLFSYDYYRNKVWNQITTTSGLRAERGTIYDASGNVLAESRTAWRIFVSPVDVWEAGKNNGVDYAALIASTLSPVLGVPYDTIYKRASNRRVIDETLLKKADEDTYRATLSVIDKNGLGDMVHTEAYATRYYPGGSFLCHVLGFTGSDSQGLFGLEYQYNDLLTGEDGYYLYAKDANGNEMPSQYVGYVPAKDGNSIVTTIDSYIQQQLEYQIDQILNTYDAQNRVCGIVMNVRTGAILAMATTNGFDCNSPYQLDDLYDQKLKDSGLDPASDAYKKLKNELLYTMWSNKPVSELYEPGSTFKIFTAAVGLETGATTMNDRYSCSGALQIGGYRISCHKRGGHGSGFTFSYGLQNSCNPTMMTVAAKIGADRFYDYFVKFGYMDKTGIDLPSEPNTLFHKKDAIGTTELATASFGQRFKISILRQLTCIACVANGGTAVTPYLVEQVVDANGNVIYTHPFSEGERIISEDTARQIADCLEAGVSGDGGAKNAYVAGYRVAAKTGTSQKFDILDENGNSYLRVGSCVAFAPAGDADIAAIIVVDEPQNGKYGSMVAAPYISALFEKVLPYLGEEASVSDADKTVTAGNYISKSVNEAAREIKSSGLSVRVIGNGDTVLSQVPAAGCELNQKLGCILLYTDSAPTELCVVPKLTGLDAETAVKALLSAGLNVEIAGAKNYYIGKNAIVATQSADAGLTVPRGSVIRLTFVHTDDQD